MEKVDRFASSFVLKQKLYRFAHDGRTALTKLDGTSVEADDTLFLCLDFLVRQAALAQFLLFQLGQGHGNYRRVRTARQQLVQEDTSFGPQSQGFFRFVGSR